jgi:uncharacterized integral membrane protein
MSTGMATSPPEPEPAPVQPVETRRDSLGRHAHRARLYTWSFVLVAALVVLVALILSNTRQVRLSWVFGTTHASLVWIILATAVVSWLLGLATSIVFRRRTRRTNH